MADVSQADADYYQAISKAVAKAHAKAVLRKAAAYAKAKAPMPPPMPLPTAKVMRSVIEDPEALAHIGVIKRALDARARPIADMPVPPAGYDEIGQRAARTRKLFVEASGAYTQTIRNLKRQREEPEPNEYIAVGNLAEAEKLRNANVVGLLDMHMNANGFPTI